MALKSLICCAAIAAILSIVPAFGQARIGEAAPTFTATDSHGQAQSLDKYKGKYVVLEWHNQGCPYVKKHYGAGNMQRLQKDWTARGVAWIKVLSSHGGEQGAITPAEEVAYNKAMKASPTASLMDADGALGRAFQAKTTPHMFVLDPAGVVIYSGAIDDQPKTDPGTVKIAHNYVEAALTEAMAGKPVSVATTRPYG